MIANKMIKMNFNGEFKRSCLPESFEELKKVLIRAYSISEEELKVLSISYMDDEGDKVIISDEFDYHQSIIYLEKENNKCLKVNLDRLPEIKKNSQNFEIISHPLEKFILSPKSNENKNSENNLHTLNDLRLSGNLVKSEIIYKNEGIENDSNDESCKELINNMKYDPDLKLNVEIKTEDNEKPQSEFKNPYKKIENKIVKHFEKVKNNLRKNAKKIGNLTQNFIEKILSKIKMQNKKTEPEGVDSFKKKFTYHIKKVIEKNMKTFKINLVKEISDLNFKEIDRLLRLEQKSSLNTKLANKINISVHTNVICDGCNINPIVGSRYKCSICKDFDFCEDCENNNFDHNHAFIKIRSPNLEPIKIITSIIEEESKEQLSKKISKIESDNFYNDKLIDLDKNIKISLDENQKVFQEEKINLGFDIQKLLELNDSNYLNKVQKEISSLSSKCLTENLTFETRNHINEIRKSIKLKNNCNLNWPKPCYFKNIQTESNIYGPATPISVQVNPEKEIFVDICLNLKNVIESGEYISVWQLQNNKRKFFGEKVILKIKVNYPEDISIKPEFVEIPKEIFFGSEKNIDIKTCADLLKYSQPKINHMDLVQKIKQMYDMREFKDNQILYAVVISQGNIENALNLLQSRKGRFNYHQKNYI
jgi:hypothetical protein